VAYRIVFHNDYISLTKLDFVIFGTVPEFAFTDVYYRKNTELVSCIMMLFDSCYEVLVGRVLHM